MELKDFIKKTVKDISESITELRTEGIQIVVGGFDDINFDIAVTVTEATDVGGGGGLKVGFINVNAKADFQESNSEYSRIKFKLTPVHPK